MDFVIERKFEAALEEGVRFEQGLDWAGALRRYEALLVELRAQGPWDALWHARVAAAEMRRGNALLELRRPDEARAALDESLHRAKDSEDPVVLGQALVAAGVLAGSTGDLRRAEAFLLQSLHRFSPVDSGEARQGAGWALLNLAAVYGKTGRLDLAFVTFETARQRLYALQNWVGVAAAWEAQAQIRRAIGDEDRWREDLAEAVTFYDRQGMAEKAAQVRGMLKGKLL